MNDLSKLKEISKDVIRQALPRSRHGMAFKMANHIKPHKLSLVERTPRVSTRAWSWQAQLSTLHAWCVWSPWHRVGPGEDAMAPSTKIQSVQRNIVQNVKRNIAQIGANGSK